MSDFRTLFAVQVVHEYFGDGPCAALEFRLDRSSRSLADRAGIMIRRAPDGVDCYYDHDQAESLRPWLSDPDEPFRLLFRVTATDSAFVSYTEAASPEEDLLLFLSAERDTSTEEPSILLKMADRVTRAEFDALDLGKRQHVVELPDGSRNGPEDGAEASTPRDTLLKTIITDRDKRLPPVRFLVVTVDPSAITDAPAEPYRLGFAARKTIWRYHLLGPLAEREAFIQPQASDNGEDVEFVQAGLTALPGDRVAKTFVSSGPLPLRQHSGRRFQLREPSNGSSNGSSKILIRRLPVASPDGLGFAPIDGRQTVVSDIYVNS